jgi:hypothetical protein
VGGKVGRGVLVLVGDGEGIWVGVDVGKVTVEGSSVLGETSAPMPTDVAAGSIGAGVGGALAQPAKMDPAPRTMIRSIDCRITERNFMGILSPQYRYLSTRPFLLFSIAQCPDLPVLALGAIMAAVKSAAGEGRHVRAYTNAGKEPS